MITGAVAVPAAELMVIVSDLVLLPAEFAAVTANVNVPAVVGVPLITPELNDKPVGNVPLDILKVMGAVPVAVQVSL